MLNKAFLPMLATLMLCIAACGNKDDVNLNQAPAFNESKAEKEAAVRDAFKEAPAEVPASESTTREIQQMFNRFTDAGNSYDADAALRFVHFEHLIDVGLSGLGNDRQAEQIKKDVRRQLPKETRSTWFRRGAGVFDWLESRVTRVQLSDDGKLAVAYVRHLLDEYGTLDKARWWLVSTPQGWKVYDWEYFSTGIRFSTTWGKSAVFFLKPGAKIPKWVQDRDYFGDVRIAIGNGDYDQALRLLEQAGHSDYPVEFEAVRYQQMSLCHYENGDFAAGLATADKALKLRKDLPEGRVYRARNLLGLGRYEEALKEFNWYIETLGSDPVALKDLGDCLTWLERWDEAEEKYLLSLQDFPTSSAISGLAYCLDEGEYDQLADWFTKLRHPEWDYEWLIADLYNNLQSNEPTEAINQAYRKINPDDPNLAWYTAMVAIDANKPGEAAKALKPALSRAPEDEKEAFRDQYWRAMALDGKAAQALKEAGGTDEAFFSLAGTCLDGWLGGPLNELCEVWRKGNEKDHRLHFYLGEADYILEDYAAAEPHYRKGLDLAEPKEGFYEGLWHGLVDSMQEQDKSVEAYNERGATDEVFVYLANTLVYLEKVDELEKLLETHEAEHEKHVELNRIGGELAWLRADWETAAGKFSAYLDAKNDHSETPWNTLNRCVRSMIRLQQFDAAKKRAEDGLSERDNYLLIVVYAAWDKPANAMRAVDAYVGEDGDEASSYWITELYNDEDVGQKMREPAYEKLHNRFPVPEPDPEEPAENEPADSDSTD